MTREEKIKYMTESLKKFRSNKRLKRYQYIVPARFNYYFSLGCEGFIPDNEMEAIEKFMANLPRSYDDSLGNFFCGEEYFDSSHDIAGLPPCECMKLYYDVICIENKDELENYTGYVS